MNVKCLLVDVRSRVSEVVNNEYIDENKKSTKLSELMFELYQFPGQWVLLSTELTLHR